MGNQSKPRNKPRTELLREYRPLEGLLTRATLRDTQIVRYGDRICCRWIEEVTVDVRFALDGHIAVDSVKTLLEVDCRGDWGKSNNDSDDE